MRLRGRGGRSRRCRCGEEGAEFIVQSIFLGCRMSGTSLCTLPEARRAPTYLRILLNIHPPRLPPVVGGSKGFLPYFELSADLFALGVSRCVTWVGESRDGHGIGWIGGVWWD